MSKYLSREEQYRPREFDRVCQLSLKHFQCWCLLSPHAKGKGKQGASTLVPHGQILKYTTPVAKLTGFQTLEAGN